MQYPYPMSVGGEKKYMENITFGGSIADFHFFSDVKLPNQHASFSERSLDLDRSQPRSQEKSRSVFDGKLYLQ